MPINIHDKFTKAMLSEPELARDFLKSYLPNKVVDILDFSTMVYMDTSYISEDLTQTFSDLVWKIKTKMGLFLNISILLEHKSYIDQNTSFQIMQYLSDAYRKQIKENKKVELIIPVLYYHGEKKWDYKSFASYFEAYPGFLRKYLPAYELEFVNLQALSEEQILNLANGLLASSLLAQKNSKDLKRLNRSVKLILENIEPYLQTNFINSIFVYMIQISEFDKDTFKEKIMALTADIRVKNKVLSVYDQLIQEGMEKGRYEGFNEGIEKGRYEGFNDGIEKGIEKGLEKGLEKGKEETVLNSYALGISIDIIANISGYSLEKVKRILKENKRL